MPLFIKDDAAMKERYARAKRFAASTGAPRLN